MEKTPMVSVVMITYNHENYIKQAIEGILMQDFDFDLELIIANDNSTDNTHQVIQNTLERDIPEEIHVRYYNHETNKGMMTNFVWALQQAQGKYIALCEGDDYWNDTLKLKKQVSFLENNMAFVGIFTDINVLNSGSIQHKALKEKHRTDHNFNSFFKEAWIPTLTLLFRTKNVEKFNVPPSKIVSADLTLFAHLLTHGELKFLDEVTGVYRQHSGGVWSGANQFKILNNRIELNKYFIKTYGKNETDLSQILKNRIKSTYYKKAKLHKANKEYFKIISCLFKSRF
jgi:glycosyltransferase involved in cell wall biosynthesis